jgi:hypothetical protein
MVLMVLCLICTYVQDFCIKLRKALNVSNVKLQVIFHFITVIVLYTHKHVNAHMNTHNTHVNTHITHIQTKMNAVANTHLCALCNKNKPLKFTMSKTGSDAAHSWHHNSNHLYLLVFVCMWLLFMFH